MQAPGPSFRRHRARSAVLAAISGLVAVAAAACAGSTPEKVDTGSDQGGRGGAVAPRPKGGVEGPARELAAAVAAEECAAVRRLSFAGIPKGDGQDCQRLLGQLKGLKPGRSEQYGTAAVVDFTTDARPLAFAFLVNREGDFRWALRIPAGKGKGIVGTEPPPANELESVAARATDALRSGECDQLAAAAEGVVPEPKLAAQSCQARKGLRKNLADDPGARPRLLGANRRVAFFSLAPAPRGPYDTLVLLQKGKRSAFARDFPVVTKRKKN